MISTTSTPTWTGMVPVDDTALAVTDSGGSGTPELERDAWIMLAAQIPDIDAVIAEKHRQLDEDPDMTRLYRLLSSVSEWSPDDPRVVELADIIEQLRIRGIESGEVEIGDADASDPFAVLLDSAMAESTPVARRLLAILEQRGWRGWMRLERVPEGSSRPSPAAPASE